jgi:glucose/arabinose dehydrogenase
MGQILIRHSRLTTIRALLLAALVVVGMTSPAAADIITYTNFLEVDQYNTSTGTVSRLANGFPSLGGITQDQAGNFYVAVFNTGVVDKITPAGVVTPYTPALGHGGLDSVAFDGQGNLYVSTQDGTIVKVTPGGTLSNAVTGLSQPYGMAFGFSGSDVFLFAANNGNGTVTATNLTTSTTTTVASGLNGPADLKFDSSGNLFVSSVNAGRVYEISNEGVLSTFASGFSQPLGLAFDSQGDLLVAQNGNGNLSSVTPSGTVSLVKSGLGNQFLTDGYVAPTAIPEPSSIGLFALASVVVVLYRRRQCRRPCTLA